MGCSGARTGALRGYLGCSQGTNCLCVLVGTPGPLAPPPAPSGRGPCGYPELGEAGSPRGGGCGPLLTFPPRMWQDRRGGAVETGEVGGFFLLHHPWIHFSATGDRALKSPRQGPSKTESGLLGCVVSRVRVAHASLKAHPRVVGCVCARRGCRSVCRVCGHSPTQPGPGLGPGT